MFNFSYITIEEVKEHNATWPQIYYHPGRKL